jgi:hypothetical protein
VNPAGTGTRPFGDPPRIRRSFRGEPRPGPRRAPAEVPVAGVLGYFARPFGFGAAAGAPDGTNQMSVMEYFAFGAKRASTGIPT